jgi:hypothetical protein
MSKTEDLIANTVHTEGSGLENEISSVASDILTAVKTVDGVGSGLDSDLWQGGTQTTSASDASGGVDGDFWFQY